MGCCLERDSEQPSGPVLQLVYLDGEPNPADQILRDANVNDIVDAMWNEGFGGSASDSDSNPPMVFDQEGDQPHHAQINGGHKRLELFGIETPLWH